MHPLPCLLDAASETPFPPVEHALADPDGLLAVGGDLSPTRFLTAYRNGIFPWFSGDQPILWWSPSQRAVFPTEGVHLSNRLRRHLRNSSWHVRADTAFARVVAGCAAPRAGHPGGTWITAGMRAAYMALHQLGHAHSIEVFDGDRLIGGLLGLSFGHMFCGDSMYSSESGASSLALAMLARRLHDWGWPLIDAQVPNPHTQRLGVQSWSRANYLAALSRLRDLPWEPGNWTHCFGTWPASEFERG